MFSGIIEELGEIRQVSRQGNATVLRVKARKTLEDAKVGDSISVNGVCLTVVAAGKDTFDFQAMPETLKVTGLGNARTGEKVNLERALKVGDRVSGHFVTGHIDCRGIIRKKVYKGGNLAFEISVPPAFYTFIVPKGSIALDGISLTIVDKTSSGFSVYIIPHTLKETTLSFKGPSHTLNVEFDILLKEKK